MVNPGDNVPNTLKAEFGEEALNSLEATEEEKKQLSAFIDKLFGNGKTVCFFTHLLFSEQITFHLIL